tara:strand:+ start:2007 stop:3068 length:1062 start_codon:yes stop_codon:yes gene_type:complete
MSNFTKSIVYSTTVLAAGVVAIFAIYNNVSTDTDGAAVAGITPAAGTSTIGINFENVIDEAKTKATLAASDAKEAVGNAAEATGEAIEGATQAAGEAISDAAEGAKETMDNVIGAEEGKSVGDVIGEKIDAIEPAAAGSEATEKPADVKKEDTKEALPEKHGALETQGNIVLAQLDPSQEQALKDALINSIARDEIAERVTEAAGAIPEQIDIPTNPNFGQVGIVNDAANSISQPNVSGSDKVALDDINDTQLQATMSKIQLQNMLDQVQTLPVDEEDPEAPAPTVENVFDDGSGTTTNVTEAQILAEIAAQDAILEQTQIQEDAILDGASGSSHKADVLVDDAIEKVDNETN